MLVHAGTGYIAKNEAERLADFLQGFAGGIGYSLLDADNLKTGQSKSFPKLCLSQSKGITQLLYRVRQTQLT